MKSPFKRKSETDVTEIRVLRSSPSGATEIYVSAKTSEKALDLIKKLEKT